MKQIKPWTLNDPQPDVFPVGEYVEIKYERNGRQYETYEYGQVVKILQNLRKSIHPKTPDYEIVLGERLVKCFATGETTIYWVGYLKKVQKAKIDMLRLKQ